MGAFSTALLERMGSGVTPVTCEAVMGDVLDGFVDRRPAQIMDVGLGAHNPHGWVSGPSIAGVTRVPGTKKLAVGAHERSGFALSHAFSRVQQHSVRLSWGFRLQSSKLGPSSYIILDIFDQLTIPRG